MADKILEWIDVKSFIRRRRKSFGFLFFTIFLSSIIIAFALPSIYRGETTLSVEEQQIPENIIESAIAEYAELRLNNIRRQVFSYNRLKEIIEQFELYPEIREKYGISEAIRKMGKSIGLETESAMFQNPKTGQPMWATISFVLFYEGRDPETVQKVTNSLGELFLEEDSKRMEKRSTATTDFLSTELENLKEQLQLFDKKISEFKQKHYGLLPEFSRVNLENIDRLERELERVSMHIRDLQDRKHIIKSQMATIDPMLPIMIDGKNMARNPAESLKHLRLNLISRQAVLHDKHPDITKLKREIEELENQVGSTNDYQGELKRLNSLKVEFASMEGRLGPNHPDVVKSAKEIEILEKSIADKVNKESVGNIPRKVVPDNPLYINLMTQEASIDATIINMNNDRQKIMEELSKARIRVEKAPIVEKEYIELTRDYENTKRKYDEIMNKVLAANVAKGLDEGEIGQRFEIKNYASMPVKPHKPARLTIILLGFVLSLGLGLTVSALQEGLDNSIKNEKELTRLIGLPVLTVISNVETQEEKRRKIFRRLIWAFAVFGFVLIGAKLTHEYIMPLEELWSIMQQNAKNM